MDDLSRLESAERWYEEGLSQWAKETEEQERTGARLVCPLDELDLLDEEGYKAGFECFQRGLELNPNHIGILECIGDAYISGRGVARNEIEAAIWYRRAADKGSARGQYSLGWLYKQGEGVMQNYDIAISWYRMAAEQRLDMAALDLAYIYEIGQGVQQNFVEAAKWYRLAIEWGAKGAQQAFDDMLTRAGDIAHEHADGPK
jgi:TPR repeat protein